MKRWLPLVALAGAQFIMVLDQSVMNVAISQLVEDFDTTVTTIQAVITLLQPGDGDVHAHRRQGRRHPRAAPHVRHRARHLRLRVGAHRSGADRRRARARLVGARRHRRRARAAGDGRTDRRQLRGPEPQDRLRDHRRRRRRRHRHRPDRRRLGHDRTQLACRVRRRGRHRDRDPGHDPLRAGRTAQRTQAAARRGRIGAHGGRSRRHRARHRSAPATWGWVKPKNSPVEPFGFSPDAVPHGVRRGAAVGIRPLAASPRAGRRRTHSSTSTCSPSRACAPASWVCSPRTSS